MGAIRESDVARGGTSISRSESKSRSEVRDGVLGGKSILGGLPAATAMGREDLVAVAVEGPGVGLAGPGEGDLLGEESPMGSTVVAQTRT